ncbi:TetR/AcrR family transcriptional regulator [Amycolatopsis rhizosphaerae]|uniref:TetR/AcrR family transcriptional regulator n=2 Tax=Amycolatopsis rhizosphaerae TaxID=2053003 RepID=A0A558DK02_9PSEU|nr:TetR/AcrR family transcriptional regulator [Amycolatopsis rhizosphaerae]
MPGNERKPASTATPGRARDGSPQNRRQALIDIAAELFAEHGFQSTTVRDIGRAAGVLSGSLYHHFQSKETILEEILSTFLDELLESCREIVAANSDPAAALRALIEAAFVSIGRHKAAITVLQNERKHLARFTWFDHVSKTEAGVRRIWVKVLEDGVAGGRFRTDLDPKITYQFIRDSVWSAARWYTPSGRLTPAQLTEQYLTLVMNGLSAPSGGRARRTGTRAAS